MNWSNELCKVAGVRIVLHWTFWILVAWIVLVGLSQDQGIGSLLLTVSLLFAVFGCVILHELGHALVAKRLGIGTRSITLLPIGGLARLEKMPEDPRQEIWIAVAGPAVNVVIAGALFAIMWLLGMAESVFEAIEVDAENPVQLTGVLWIRSLAWINVFLAGFNLLPAFPMDGGRVLRALLAYRMERVRATRVASSIGKFMALLFFLAGLLVNPFLIFISLFVFFGAEAEAQAVQVRAAFKGVPVEEVMIKSFTSLSDGQTIGEAVVALLEGSQQDFPVVDEQGRLSGLLSRGHIVRSLAEHSREYPVRDAMQTELPVIEQSDALEEAYPKLQEAKLSALPVVEDGRLVGVLTMENLMELVMIDRALRSHAGNGGAGKVPEDSVPGA